MRNWFQEPRHPQLRHPQPRHPQPRQTSQAKQLVRVSRTQVIGGMVTLLTIALLLLVVLMPSAASVSEEPLTEAGASDSLRLRSDCVMIQRLSFAPCDHALTRRVALPADLVGKTRAELEASMDDWRVTGFSAASVEMEQQLDIHCPQHTVLMPDEGGLLCVWQNTYGDAYSMLEELNIPISDFPDETQQRLRRGLGFNTREELDAWLENAES